MLLPRFLQIVMILSKTQSYLSDTAITLSSATSLTRNKLSSGINPTESAVWRNLPNSPNDFAGPRVPEILKNKPRIAG